VFVRLRRGKLFDDVAHHPRPCRGISSSRCRSPPVMRGDVEEAVDQPAQSDARRAKDASTFCVNLGFEVSAGRRALEALQAEGGAA